MVDISYARGIDENPLMSQEEIMTLIMRGLSDRTRFNVDEYIEQLALSPDILPNNDKIRQAVDRLVRYDFIKYDDGIATITADGKLIESLPLGYPASAAFCEAYSLDMLAYLLPLIALIEVGDCRYNRRKPMTGDTWTKNECVNQLTTITQYIYAVDDRKPPVDLRALASEHNVSLIKYNALRGLVATLEAGTSSTAQWHCYLPIKEEEDRKLFENLTTHVTERAFPPSQKMADRVQHVIGTLGALLQQALSKNKT